MSEFTTSTMELVVQPSQSDMAAVLREEMQAQGPVGPGMPWRHIAASAYRAYAASTENKNFRGDPMPAFDDLPQPIRTAWEAAARQVHLCTWWPTIAAEAEQSWLGWTPPHLRCRYRVGDTLRLRDRETRVVIDGVTVFSVTSRVLGVEWYGATNYHGGNHYYAEFHPLTLANLHTGSRLEIVTEPEAAAGPVSCPLCGKRQRLVLPAREDLQDVWVPDCSCFPAAAPAE